MNRLSTSYQFSKWLRRSFILMTWVLIAACSSGGGGGGGNNPGSGNTGGSSDTLAPEFKGIVFSSVTNLDKITLAWLPAKDDTTPTPEINYEVYASEIENLRVLPFYLSSMFRIKKHFSKKE